MNTAVAKKKSAELSTDVMDDMFADGGEGAAFDASELMIPYVRLAQQMSPQINKKDGKYIEGLSSGDMYNTLTNAIYDGEDGLNVVPCYVTTKYAEFVTRENGGGFVQELDASDPVIRQTTKDGTMDMLPSGNQLVKADEYYCLIVDDEGGWEPAVVDMKVTAMKVSKRWKTQVAMNKAKNPKTGQMQILPIFSTIWKLTTVDETNKRNETYSNYSVSKVGVIKDSTLYQEARAFRQSIAAGEVKASEGQQSEKPAAPVGDDEIPF